MALAECQIYQSKLYSINEVKLLLVRLFNISNIYSNIVHFYFSTDYDKQNHL